MVFTTGDNKKLAKKGIETVDRIFFGGSDACQGDSGGPMIKWKTAGDGTTNAVQVGIVSRGMGCAFKDQPGIYERVDAYKGYIQEIIKDGGCRKYKL